ncbi:MAG: hypothetical protein Q8K58_00425 [Acidimicrobiales bacterium]|nr:hypothetical protein [Acidimicrobiales bacterium]
MLLLTALTIAGVWAPEASAAAVDGGGAQVIAPEGSTAAGQPLTSGGSATPFTLLLPTGAACTGDSANDDYRVQSYMVPGSVEPSTLTFGELGPIPSGFRDEPYRQPLYQETSSAFVNAQTSDASVDGGPGPVVNIPTFAVGPEGVFVLGDIPAGTYNIGIACTLGPASATQLDKYWNTQLTVVESAADAPAGVTWTASDDPPTTTSTTAGGASTTSSSSSTSTTAGGATTSSTSTTTASSSTTVTNAPTGGSPSGTSVMSTVGSLPLTGSSTTALVIWAVLLLLFGRMAVLLARPPRLAERR